MCLSMHSKYKQPKAKSGEDTSNDATKGAHTLFDQGKERFSLNLISAAQLRYD